MEMRAKLLEKLFYGIAVLAYGHLALLDYQLKTTFMMSVLTANKEAFN